MTNVTFIIMKFIFCDLAKEEGREKERGVTGFGRCKESFIFQS